MAKNYLLLLPLILAGCFSTPEPEVTEEPKDAKSAILAIAGKKDTAAVQTEAYLDVVEKEVSKAVSGLMAVQPTLDGPDLSKAVLEAQIERLKGLAKPTVEELEGFRAALEKDNATFVKADKADADKVDDLTNERWKIADKARKEVDEANSRADKAEKALKELQTQETLEDVRMAFISIGGLFLVAGMGLMVAGVWTGLARLKTSGLYSLGAGMGLVATPIFLPTILMQPWFSYTAGGILLALLAYMAYSVAKSKSCLTPVNTPTDITPADSGVRDS
jgi:hypothetical protein